MADTKDIKTAARVSRFMMQMAQDHPERWQAVRPWCIPYGDLAYGTALMHWYKDGRPKKKAWFSYAEGEQACPYLMEFRKEIAAEFGLPILTAEEAKEEIKRHDAILTRRVHDWGVN